LIKCRDNFGNNALGKLSETSWVVELHEVICVELP